MAAARSGEGEPRGRGDRFNISCPAGPLSFPSGEASTDGGAGAGAGGSAPGEGAAWPIAKETSLRGKGRACGC